MVRFRRLCSRLPSERVSPEKDAPFREISPDVLDAYLHRVEAYATMIVVGSLIFGFAATTTPTEAKADSSLDSLRQATETCLLMGTLATSAFPVVISSTLVYHSLKLTSAMGLAAFSLPEGVRAEKNATSFILLLRSAFDRYMKKSGHLRGWSRVSLAVSLIMYLAAVGIDRASTVPVAAAIVIGCTLLGGTIFIMVGVRSLSFDYRISSIALKSAESDFYRALHSHADVAAIPASPASRPPVGVGVESDAIVSVAAGSP